jgi:hypothetical protein
MEFLKPEHTNRSPCRTVGVDVRIDGPTESSLVTIRSDITPQVIVSPGVLRECRACNGDDASC